MIAQLVRNRASIRNQAGLDPKSIMLTPPLCQLLGKDYLCTFWVSFQNHPGRLGTYFYPCWPRFCLSSGQQSLSSLQESSRSSSPYQPFSAAPHACRLVLQPTGPPPSPHAGRPSLLSPEAMCSSGKSSGLKS